MVAHVLIVDDDEPTRKLVALGLRPQGFTISSAASAEEALAILASRDVDVLITDLRMPRMEGLDLCDQVVERFPSVPVLIVTAFGSLDAAIQAIRAGAFDFIEKPFEMDVLALAVVRALRYRDLRAEVRRLRAATGQAGWSDDLIGTSPAMADLRSLLEKVAMSDATALVTGESGTGKEVVARALHSRGKRRGGPFVAVNCAAMPEPLLESELFGHVRGAFTDAKSPRAGLLSEASGGTLFLDEIGDMPLGLQPKLLRALEQRSARPVGGNSEIPFDVRLVAATNRDLEAAIEEGRFREDLYYRLNVLHVPLPPLRSRGGDVLLLAQHFVTHFAGLTDRDVSGISSPAAAKLMAYPWPGNVRELRNAMERAVALTSFDSIAVDDLPARVRDYKSRFVVVAGNDPSDLVPLHEVEKRYILRVFEVTGGNKSLAAKTLGLNRKTLYRKLAEYGLETE